MAANPQAAPPSPTPRQRRRARALAFQTVYEVDVSGHRPAEVLQRLSLERRTDPAVFEYARHLVTGVVQYRREIDQQIRRYAALWPLAQMSAIDRNVLRLAVFEAVHDSNTIPVAVAINEAVELAKLYGSESSGRFVNGVLGRIVAELGEEERGPTESDG